MKKKRKTFFLILLICTCLALNTDTLFSMGTLDGTIVSNIKDYYGSYNLPNDYLASFPGELVVTFTNVLGTTNTLNGKFFYTGGTLITNITTWTVSAGYDISSIPAFFAGNSRSGTYVDYVYLITNKGNTSDNLSLRVLPVSTDDPTWTGNIFSLFVNGSSYVSGQAVILTNISNISADEVLNLRVRLQIPGTVENMSTNLFSLEIWNSVWNTNTSTGDSWPGVGAIPPVSLDTNDSRDYQLSYVRTLCYGIEHVVSVISADDMLHTINKFDGSETLGTTRLKINIVIDSPPIDKNSFYLIYNINKTPTGGGGDEVRVKVEGDGLNYYALIFSEDDVRISNGAQFNFMIAVDNEVYYIDGRDGVTPWSFKLKDIQMQANNVSILNNLLNPRKGQKTIVLYSLSKPSKVQIEVFTLSGEKIATLYKGYQSAGFQGPIYWDGKNTAGNEVGEGLYFVNFRTEEFNEIRKVIVVK
ncbi:MAG: hypothetical protein KKH98_07725 [Spirochaetes bacterium]|nr:hypothetical protein [Spirochaetota bacterium]